MNPEAPLLDELQRLEAELHHAGQPIAGDRVEALLHADFHEIGRSGRRYSRQTVVAYLGQAVEVQPSACWDFAVHRLAPDVALLTYRSAQRDAAGQPVHAAARVSVWRHSAAGWQLYYHQGTPTPAD